MKLEANEEFTVSLSSHSVWIKLYKSCFAEFDPFCSSVMSNVRAAFRFGDFPLATMIPFSSLFAFASLDTASCTDNANDASNEESEGEKCPQKRENNCTDHCSR